MNFAWYRRLSRREQLLLLLVSGALFLLVNFFVWDALLGAIKRTQADVSEQRSARKLQAVFMTERDIWRKREEWLEKHQPPLRSAGESSALLDEVKEIAGKHNILIENPQFMTGEKTPNYQAMGVSMETKSPWPPLVRFLHDVQQPEKFIVFENIKLTVDGADPTQMRGQFRIARWYAPTATTTSP